MQSESGPADLRETMSEPWDALRERIATRQATVAIVGLGYVGLPLAMAFVNGGFPVIGFDINVTKITTLSSGASDILDVPSAQVREAIGAGRLQVTTEPAPLREADVIIICVPTPCYRNRQPDLTYIENAAKMLAQVVRRGQLIVLESTTYPGTTEELLLPILTTSGLHEGDDLLVAFSPERVDPGNPTFYVENTPKVVGGLGPMAGDLAGTLYGTVVERIVRVDSPREAEMAKLIENTFRHINIALANELALIAGKMGINIWQAIDAAATKPFGFMPFYPGPGVGGHCIPIDPHYLSWKAREMGAEVSFIELAERINGQMPLHVVRMVIDAVNRQGKSILNSQVLLLGLAYKRDIDDLRESPALAVLDLLHGQGAQVSYHDPFVPQYTHHGEEMTSVALTPDAIAAADCVLLVTAHSSLNLAQIAEYAQLIVDTRNAFTGITGNIVRL